MEIEDMNETCTSILPEWMLSFTLLF